MLEAVEADLRQQMRDVHGDGEALLRRMQDSFSNALQPSEFKACLAESPVAEADELARIYLERPRRRGSRELSSRQAIYQRMRGEFERVGVWDLMWRDIPASQFTRSGDPLKIDTGYAAGAQVKMFHALSLEHDVNAAKVLGFSFPRIAEGILRLQNQQAELTAIVEDDLPMMTNPSLSQWKLCARAKLKSRRCSRCLKSPMWRHASCDCNRGIKKPRRTGAYCKEMFRV